MYALLAAVWVVSGWIHRPKTGGDEFRRVRFDRWIRVLTGGLFLIHTALVFRGVDAPFVRLGTMFFMGASAWGLRDRIVLRTSWMSAALAVVVAAAVWQGHSPGFDLLYRVLMPYILLHWAYVPDGPIRWVNRLSDCSFGIYIYAFPVQQVWMALHPDLTVWGLTVCAWLTTVVLALLSWHAVEKPCLDGRHRVTAMGAWLVQRRSVAARRGERTRAVVPVAPQR